MGLSKYHPAGVMGMPIISTIEISPRWGYGNADNIYYRNITPLGLWECR